AEHHDLRLVLALAVEEEPERDSAVLQVLAQRPARVEAAAAGLLPPHGDDVLPALRELRHRLLHPAHLLLRAVREAPLRHGLEALAIAAIDVLAVELLANHRLQHVGQVLHATVEERAEAAAGLGVEASERALQALHLAREAAEAERARDRVAELALLEPVLDV